MEWNRRKFIKNSVTTGTILSVDALLDSSKSLSAYAKEDNLFLQDNYAPVSNEVYFPDLEIEGKIPDDFEGTYYRNGPNPIYPTQPYHWFDGDGMIHAVSIKDGKASYRNRFIQTSGFLKEYKEKKSLYNGILTGSTIKNSSKNSSNTSIIWRNKQLLSLWEGGEPYLLTPETLDTEGTYNFKETLRHPFTAHPKIDPLNDELLFFGYQAKEKPYLYYSIANSKGNIVHSTPIDLPYPVMMHDFAITENYTLFFDLPAIYGINGVEFKPELGARVGILPRRGMQKDICWFAIAPCFVFHVANAHEEENSIVLTGCRYEKYPQLLTDRAILYQWRFNLANKTVNEKPLGKFKCEFPKINENLVGRYAQYIYVALDGNDAHRGIVKYNLRSGKTASKIYTYGLSAQEMQFIPRENSKTEDDGYLVGFVFNKTLQCSELLVLDAIQLNSVPIARIKLPVRVPYGFHGTWVPQIFLK